MKTLFVVVAMFAATAAFADGPRGRVDAAEGYAYVVVPVVHDTTGRSPESLTPAEKTFLASIPNKGSGVDGLRDACQEMLLGGVIHLTTSGKYCPGSSANYWRVYQGWTGPHKVRVPLVPGPRGPRGERGPQGPPGEVVYVEAPAPRYRRVIRLAAGGIPIIGINRATVTSHDTPGIFPGVAYILGQAVRRPSRTTIANTNANSNSNVNANNNSINIGDGSATGSASGSGNSAAQGYNYPGR